jgi:hypothetical protein
MAVYRSWEADHHHMLYTKRADGLYCKRAGLPRAGRAQKRSIMAAALKTRRQVSPERQIAQMAFEASRDLGLPVDRGTFSGDLHREIIVEYRATKIDRDGNPIEVTWAEVTTPARHAADLEVSANAWAVDWATGAGVPERPVGRTNLKITEAVVHEIEELGGGDPIELAKGLNISLQS